MARDPNRYDSDRDYGAREDGTGQGADRGARYGDPGISARDRRDRDRAPHPDARDYGHLGQGYESQRFGVGERRGGYGPRAYQMPSQYSGIGGGRTDPWGGRGSDQCDEKAGWRAENVHGDSPRTDYERDGIDDLHRGDADYLSWRDRQMLAFDRDYADYRRERQQRFHADFDAWRAARPKK